ncbi:hypothetical protein BDV96DRAFT_233287 [Lophiotrema nucula]|uniref:Uncharacterized protein n=1 Tax=Lophiotrema nucula TaxID=690887 RepID=A0A6A5YT79_9PLEO|nr:hypothetical protein BDV96DRAFT_233287 [Lophiotrema nucula]
MARRFTRELPIGEEKPTSGPVSLAGFIALQPNKKKGNKSWRPLQLSDFGDDEDDLGDMGEADDFDLSAEFNQRLHLDTSQPLHAHARPSLYDLNQRQTDGSPLGHRQAMSSTQPLPVNSSPTYTRDQSEDISPTTLRRGRVADCAALFGQLPDPIRLSEEVGAFDGQVLFIAHPSRDVSAHQWSSDSYQWINIGTYSATRGKVEGSLASDRLRGAAVPHNTLEYFKAIALRRETTIREHGRPEEQVPQEPSSTRRVEALRNTDTDRYATLSSTSGSTAGQIPSLNQTVLPRATTIAGVPTSSSVKRTVTRDYLQDPFVDTPAKAPPPAVPTALNFTSPESVEDIRRPAIVPSSMGFGYDFPTESTVSIPIQLTQAQREEFTNRERERIRLMREGSISQYDRSSSELQDVEFGEEAMSRYAATAPRPATTRPQPPLSPEDVRDRQRLKDGLAELGDQPRRPIASFLPELSGGSIMNLSRAPPRPLARPPGLTVANPTRVPSTLNANAAPYTQARAYSRHEYPTGRVPSPTSDETAVDPMRTDNLKFSDPDAVRQTQSHVVATGLGHQAPTSQNFKGPFFVNSMPTSRDPIAALAVQVSEDEKLRTWFQDGQRPARYVSLLSVIVCV